MHQLGDGERLKKTAVNLCYVNHIMQLFIDSNASNSATPKKMKRTLLDHFDSSSSSNQTKKLKPENEAGNHYVIKVAKKYLFSFCLCASCVIDCIL